MFTCGPTHRSMRRSGAALQRCRMAPPLPRRILELFFGSRGAWRGVGSCLLALGIGSGCLQVMGDVDVVGGLDPTQVNVPELMPLCSDAGANQTGCRSCQPGRRRCDGPLLEVCKPTADGWDLIEQCPTPGLCDAETGACQLPVCRPLQYQCSENGELRRCNADQTGFELDRQCASRAFCSDERGRERCESVACNPGDRRCNGAQLEECRDDQMGFDPLMACINSALCVQEGPGQARCATPLCESGQNSCNGRELRLCSIERNAWSVVNRCQSAPLCNLDMRRCDPIACLAGQQRCVNGVLQRCNDFLTDFAPVVDCAAQNLFCDSRVTTCLTMPAATPDPGPTPLPPVTPQPAASALPDESDF
jgi:hypothetical protein